MNIDEALEFMKDHGGWIVAFVVAIICGLYALLRKSDKSNGTTLKQKGGKCSSNYQAGGDLNINGDDKR